MIFFTKKIIFVFILTTFLSFFYKEKTCIANNSAQFWIEREFQPSTLSKTEQLEEMEWFTEAAKPFKGMTISVSSTRHTTHEYESTVLPKAFEEITGIRVNHDILDEKQILEKLQFELKSGAPIYNAYLIDNDYISARTRKSIILNLTEWIRGEGNALTLPSLNLADLIGLSITTDVNGNLYQIPNSSIAYVYWFRQDIFAMPEVKKKFMDTYGYNLGVPLNWAAYEDIADFFTNIMEVNGESFYGHAGIKSSSKENLELFYKLFMPLAGVRTSIISGNELISPSAKYAMNKFVNWEKKYAPPFKNVQYKLETVVQNIVWPTTLISEILESNNLQPDFVNIKWRIAPAPHGAYWKKGMKSGYKKSIAWTITTKNSLQEQKAVWLYMQFCIAKTISLKKAHETLMPNRYSDINHESFTDRAQELAGLVEFYRSSSVHSYYSANKYINEAMLNIPLFEYDFSLDHIRKSDNFDHQINNTLQGFTQYFDKIITKTTHISGHDDPRKRWRETAMEDLAGKDNPLKKQKGITVNYKNLIETFEVECIDPCDSQKLINNGMCPGMSFVRNDDEDENKCLDPCENKIMVKLNMCPQLQLHILTN